MAETIDIVSSDIFATNDALGQDISREVQTRLRVLIDGGDSRNPGEAFIELVHRITFLLKEDRLEQLVLDPMDKRKLGGYISLLFGETHGGGAGKKAKKLYEDYLTPEEWKMFWNWVEGNHLH